MPVNCDYQYCRYNLEKDNPWNGKCGNCIRNKNVNGVFDYFNSSTEPFKEWSEENERKSKE